MTLRADLEQSCTMLRSAGDEKIIAHYRAVIERFHSGTSHHSEKVADITKQLAQYLGCSQQAQDNLYATAQLHDVGKISIPTEIINRPGALSDAEYQLIKNHTNLGGFILRRFNTPFTLLASDVAQFHHERMDGSGYGTYVGAAIPAAARLVAVADVFDALTSNRPYRPAFAVPNALRMM